MKCYKIRDVSIDNDFPMNVFLNDKNIFWIEPPHTHDFVEIVYVEKGSGVMMLGKQSIPIYPGDIYILPIHTEHTFRFFGFLRYYNIVFSKDIFSQHELKWLLENPRFEKIFFNSNALPQCFRSSFPQTINLANYLNKSKIIREKQPFGFKADLKGYLLLIINEILRLVNENNISLPQSSLSQKRMSIAVNYIIMHYKEKIGLPALAAELNTTTDNVTHIFRRSLGCSPLRFINNVRIAEACRLLCDENNQKNISEISHECGFENSSYFTETFRKIMNCSPTQFAAAARRGEIPNTSIQ